MERDRESATVSNYNLGHERRESIHSLQPTIVRSSSYEYVHSREFNAQLRGALLPRWRPRSGSGTTPSCHESEPPEAFPKHDSLSFFIDSWRYMGNDHRLFEALWELTANYVAGIHKHDRLSLPRNEVCCPITIPNLKHAV